MALGISAAVAVAVGQSRNGAAQPELLFQQLKQSVKSHRRVTSFSGQNNPKKFLWSAIACPSEMLVWVKGSEQSPSSVSTIGISKETRTKETHYSSFHRLHFPPSVPINEALLAIINLFPDGFVYAALE